MPHGRHGWQARQESARTLPNAVLEVCMVISCGKRAPEGVYGPRVRFKQELFVKEV